MIVIVVAVLVGIAYLTLLERKVLGSMQLRVGPQTVGVWGVLQPFADAVKLLAKESIIPNHANRVIYVMAPVISLVLALIGWAVIPLGTGVVLADINIGILYLFAVSSLGAYAVLCSGWSSNSKYSFLGALRATAQMISYEVSIGLIILTVVLSAGSLNLTEIVLAQSSIWYLFPLLPASVMFFISSLAETFRPPFDCVEAESELVSGFHTEYSAVLFVLFFLSEYGHVILMSYFNVILFWGGWLPPISIPIFLFIPEVIWLGLKVSFFLFLFIWARASLPRIRFDNLMHLGWKTFLPLSLACYLFLSAFLLAFDYLPPVAY